MNRKSLQQMASERPWTTAEKQLIAKCAEGHVAIARRRPDAPSDAVEIRAELVRHLLTGGCPGALVADNGPNIRGAYISGSLDLRMLCTERALQLEDCTLERKPLLWDAQLYGLSLENCLLPGMEAHRLTTTGPVFLRGKHFRSTGTISLSSARIGGDLSFSGAEVHADFDGEGDASDGTAIDCEGVEVRGQLRLGQGFTAYGTVDLASARVTGTADMTRGHFLGTGLFGLDADAIRIDGDCFLRETEVLKDLNLMRATIGGNLNCTQARFRGDFDADSMHIEGALIWAKVAEMEGTFDLGSAYAAQLKDDAESWRLPKALRLGGFRYDRLIFDMSIGDRIDWLSRNEETPIVPHPVWKTCRTCRILPRFSLDFGTYCDPQPYTQLSGVLRRQGMSRGAERILAERDRRIFRASYNSVVARYDGSLRQTGAYLLATIRRPLHLLFGLVFGFGHRPGRAVICVALIILLNALLYAKVYDMREMAPNSDVVLTSQDWRNAVAVSEGRMKTDPKPASQPLDIWLDTSNSSDDYMTFSATLYALDLFVPLDALGQENAWAPSPARGVWGKVGYWTGWATQLSGWIITAIGAAAVAGLVGRKE